MLTAVFYILILLNAIFLVSIFFFFRSYIQRELRKNEYIRHLEKELEEFVLGMNQSAEQITQIVEDKIQQLRQLLDKHDEVKRSWSLMEHDTEQQTALLTQLKQDATQSLQDFRLEVDALEEPDRWQNKLEEEQKELLQKLQKQLEKQFEANAEKQFLPQLYKNLQERLHAKLQAEAQLKSPILEVPFSEESSPRDGTEQGAELGRQILEPKLRKEIEHYIELGLDSHIIKQKTGANLGLIEILIGMKEI